ncbi:MAG: nitrite/sulfite reductase [Planctomycetes bacterium]|nr:nitrite/sulfite reductase [Planctomycetota bacterium]
MKASNALWKERLAGKIDEALAKEVDTFEMEIELRKQGKVDEKVFAETRLRRGTYGQRYDNGQRHDGTESKKLPFEEKLTKGPMTAWDAPGMQRIKIPYGGLNPEQLEVLADLAEEYSDSIAHITTRQDVQLHFVHIEDTPSVMRRLAAAKITTREACGNSVRNVTGCPFAGVCRDEPFDVTPYARALAMFLLGHPDAQNFGRKFKPAFSGCAQHACGLTAMHDVGYTAVVRTVDGKEERGFCMVVGGGLGSVPYQAKVFEEFLPLNELLPTVQAIAKVFGKHGEKKVRSRARLKFLVADWGLEKFKAEVAAERKKLAPDPRWTSMLPKADLEDETPLKPPGEMPSLGNDERLQHWARTNLREQRQAGYVVATLALPLGDITANQLRDLADIARKFTKGTVRATVEQNLVLRWVSKADVVELYKALSAAKLAAPGASNIQDIVACPGTDTCKLGISSSRGLAAELRGRLVAKGTALDRAIQDLHIKISGCFNSCGQHHISDIGFYGVSRTVSGFRVPHFQVILGGQWEENAGSYGLPIIAIPSKRIPDAVERITAHYLKHRQPDERFTKYVRRVGKGPIRELLEPLTKDLPDPAKDATLFSDWGDPRQYSIGDIGKGECAGEVVSAYEFATTEAERMVFAAQLKLDAGDAQKAGEEAYAAMKMAAKALVQLQYDDVTDDAQEVADEFKERFYDTKVFFDPFAGGKFADYYFAAHEKRGQKFTAEFAKYTIEEAQLFIEAVHSCYNKLRTEGIGTKP